MWFKLYIDNILSKISSNFIYESSILSAQNEIKIINELFISYIQSLVSSNYKNNLSQWKHSILI